MKPINEQLGVLSEQFMLIAAGIIAIAFCLYAVDFWTYSRAAKSGLAGENEAELAPELVAVGAPKKATVDLGEGPADRGIRPTSKLRATGDDGVTAGDSMRYGGAKRKIARIATAVLVIGVVVNGLAVLFRGLAANRVPWGNMYEFCTSGAFAVGLVFVIVLTRRDLRFLGTLVTGLILIMLVGAEVGFPTPVGHLVPALQSYWIVIHVSIAVLTSALFTLTFGMSVLQLFQSKRETSIAAGKPDKAPFMRLVPNALSLENMSYRINGIAFVGWTLTLVFGSIWAEKAWGRFWGWDTKEVWTFVIWVVYAGYLHARATRGWTGTRAAWLSIVGYLCVIFNFTIVNMYFSGLHSYAGN